MTVNGGVTGEKGGSNLYPGIRHAIFETRQQLKRADHITVTAFQSDVSNEVTQDYSK